MTQEPKLREKEEEIVMKERMKALEEPECCNHAACCPNKKV